MFEVQDDADTRSGEWFGDWSGIIRLKWRWETERIGVGDLQATINGSAVGSE